MSIYKYCLCINNKITDRSRLLSYASQIPTFDPGKEYDGADDVITSIISI